MIFCAVLTLINPSRAIAETISPVEAASNKSYVNPRLLNAPPPRYPRAGLRQARQGLVNVCFTITAEGKTTGHIVDSGVNTKVFEKAAIKAVGNYRYEPAISNGKKIDSTACQTITFLIYGKANAKPSKKFITLYKEATEAIIDKDRERADIAMLKLKDFDARSISSHRYKDFAKYLYATEWGTESEQFTFLKNSAFESLSGRSLSRDIRLFTLQHLYLYYAKLQQLPEAIATYEALIEDDPTSETVKSYEASYDQIKNFALSQRKYTTTTYTNKFGRARLSIIRPYATFSKKIPLPTTIEKICGTRSEKLDVLPGISVSLGTAADCELLLDGLPLSQHKVLFSNEPI